jgi:hypothetical protein
LAWYHGSVVEAVEDRDLGGKVNELPVQIIPLFLVSAVPPQLQAIVANVTGIVGLFCEPPLDSYMK